ncbi:MAG: single-stranded DNA-binding protein [Thiotrichales bacterium]|nr:single-stranded DNA-binding protein [Thiotrichales bacterium]
MQDVNRVTLFGRAGRDATRRTLASGDGCATFTLATTATWRRKDGERAERTEWHRVVVFGPAVDAVARAVRTGRPVLVEGRLTSRTFEADAGAERRVWEVVVDARGTVSVPPAPGAP